MTIEKDCKDLFIKGAEDRLKEISKAIDEVKKNLHCDNDNSVKLAIAYIGLCHEFMLNAAPKQAMRIIQDKAVYPY